MMFGRDVRDKLPTKESCDIRNSKARQKDQKNKEAMKKYTDTARKAQPHSLHVGEAALIKNQSKKCNKLTPKWHPEPAVITRVNGNSITLMHRDKEILTCISPC